MTALDALIEVSPTSVYQTDNIAGDRPLVELGTANRLEILQ